LYQTASRLLKAGVPPHRVWWLRLDHPLLMNLELGDLVRSIVKVGNHSAADPIFLFLDELTYAKNWDLWLKTFYDETWPVTIAGSSSSTAAIRHARTESGVGRWEEQYLAPYLFGEYLELFESPVTVPTGANLAATLGALADNRPATTGLADMRRRFLLTGGFPELLIAAKSSNEDDASLLLDSQRILRSDAVERAIYKDIPQAFEIDNPLLMERLLYTLAGQMGGILSARNICQSLSNISETTFERYLSYLERAFLVFTLPNYSGSEGARQRRGKKLYFVDGAVRNAALQRGLAPLGDPTEMGALVENLAASHLHALSQHSQVRLYHWRSHGDEVDLVFDHPDQPMAFEIASSPRHQRTGLHRFIEQHPKFRGGCYVVAPEIIATNASSAKDGVGTIPLDLFLLAVSAQAAVELQLRLGA
ncbi:MAG: ATP-binding protein, partial [Chthoniobacterales bacterium]|nr:ATP-binding protein [Chthoniobacterales bacterium]